jgi:hypothetical protein
MKMKILCSLALGALASTQVEAQFTPIPLGAGSYTHDIIVEKEATQTYVPGSTASMDGGTNNTGSTWYEMGYNFDAPQTGIPAADSVIFSESAADHLFQMPADYAANNALMIDQTIREGRLTLTSPAVFSGLSLLASAANGSVVLNYTINFAGGTTETGTVTAPDWFGGTPVAITARGRVAPLSFSFSAVDTDNPRLYAVDIPIVNTTAAIQSIDFSFNSGGENGRAGIFAVSGSNGADYMPIEVTGFNQDMIVEAGATRPAPLMVTDASMDGGTANTGASWYEQGFNPRALTTGLPEAGTTLTNTSAPDHVYRMAESYTSTPNAALIDTTLPTATLTFATATGQSALSILASAGGGAVTLNYDIVHTDSSVQTGTIVIPDWFNATPFAYTTRGRVGVDSGVFSAVNTENPRLYSVDIAVERTTVPISQVTLTYASGNGHAGILALSGTAGAVRPIFDVQPGSTNVYEGSATELTASVSGTEPITFQWQREVNGTYENVSNSATITGANAATLVLSSPAVENGGNYRLVASNVGGASTSLVSRLNVFSTTQDITAPGDVVTSIGGEVPANEPVENAIDNTTTKYLNFGTDGNTSAPYVGPTGLTISPQVGSTVVSALRLYTANDAADRDPADFTLEGSNDGTTFNVIASGPLALPTGRNDAGLDLDPLTQDVQEVHFANTAGYTTYRLTFTNVRNNGAANSMQIGEIELLGEPGTGTPVGPRLSIERSGSDVTISWDGAGTLQATPTLDDPQWTTVEGTGSVTVPASGEHRFFRVVR